MSKDNFDFSGYPKLGRPFTGGSPRKKYIKFYLSDQESNDFDKLTKDLSNYYEEMGYTFNRPAHFRLLLKNLTDPIILKILFNNLTDEIEIFKR